MTEKPRKAKPPIKLPDKPFERGLVQVYTGNGKGKTTAAIGLAVRASGQGLRVYFGQFLKGSTYGELQTLPQVPNVTMVQFGLPHWTIRGGVTEEDKAAAMKGFGEVRDAVLSGDYDIVVLDEINMAVKWELIPTAAVLDLIREKPVGVEMVLTGRLAPPEIVEAADLVTEMVPVKHPFQKGIRARKGIEF